jgi:hypothetical protein
MAAVRVACGDGDEWEGCGSAFPPKARYNCALDGAPFVVLGLAEGKGKNNRRSFDLFGAGAPNFAQDDTPY